MELLNKIGFSKHNNGFFAWHGTSTDNAVIGICHEGFDPSKRSGQSFGPGEYFGQTSVVSHSYSIHSSRMIVAYILQVPETMKSGNFCYVVNNPKDNSFAYNLPLLVVSYNKKMENIQFKAQNKVPLNLNLNNSKFNEENLKDNDKVWIPAFRWSWFNDDGYRFYPDHINGIIEKQYELYKNGMGSPSFTTEPIVRYVDDIPAKYCIDFQKSIQTNIKTSYTRNIKREKRDLPVSIGNWQFMNEKNVWQSFETLIQDLLEVIMINKEHHF